jgi:hypothetical protein
MPQAIPAIATAAKAFFAKTIFTVGTYALTVGTVAKVALAAGAYAYSRAQTKKALRSIGSFNGSRGLSIREPAATRRLVYGKIRMGGTIVFADTSGANNEFLHLVIAHCEGPCNAIGTVYLNDEVVQHGVAGGSWLWRVVERSPAAWHLLQLRSLKTFAGPIPVRPSELHRGN